MLRAQKEKSQLKSDPRKRKRGEIRRDIFSSLSADEGDSLESARNETHAISLGNGVLHAPRGSGTSRVTLTVRSHPTRITVAWWIDPPVPDAMWAFPLMASDSTEVPVRPHPYNSRFRLIERLAYPNSLELSILVCLVHTRNCGSSEACMTWLQDVVPRFLLSALSYSSIAGLRCRLKRLHTPQQTPAVRESHGLVNRHP